MNNTPDTTSVSLNFDFEILDCGGNVAVPIGKNSEKLNAIIDLSSESAHFIFNLLADSAKPGKSVTLRYVIDRCAAEYRGSTEDEIKEILLSFLNNLEKAGIITVFHK